MASGHQKFRVGPHKRLRHRHRDPVRQNKIRARVAEILNDAEQVVPPSRVQTGGVLSELVENFVNLKSGRNCLNQDGCANCPVRYTQELLGETEDLSPKPRLIVALHFGKVVEGAPAFFGKERAVVKNMEAKVDQRTNR